MISVVQLTLYYLLWVIDASIYVSPLRAHRFYDGNPLEIGHNQLLTTFSPQRTQSTHREELTDSSKCFDINLGSVVVDIGDILQIKDAVATVPGVAGHYIKGGVSLGMADMRWLSGKRPKKKCCDRGPH